MKYSTALKQGNRIALAISSLLLVLTATGAFESLGLSEIQVMEIANGVFIAATLVFEHYAKRAEHNELRGSAAVTQPVDDPTPVDGTEYEQVERRRTNPKGIKTLAAIAGLGLTLSGCAHLDGWAEADRAIQSIDGQRLAACEARGEDVAKCMGVSAGGDLVRHLLRRGAEIVTRLIVARSGGGAEADGLTEAEAEDLARELDAIRTVLELEGVDLG